MGRVMTRDAVLPLPLLGDKVFGSQILSINAVAAYPFRSSSLETKRGALTPSYQ